MSQTFMHIDMSLSGYRAFALVFVMVLLLPYRIQGQITPVKVSGDTADTRNILIDHVGKLIEDSEGIEPVKWLSQGLQLRIDSTYIYGDSAVIFGEDRIFAYGNVIIQQGDSLSVFTDTLYYFRQTDIADLVGEVVLQQGTKQLWTKDLTYHLAERYGEYTQGGVLIDDGLQVSSRQGIYYAASEEVVFRDSVVVLHPRFNLAADSMKYLAGLSTVLFTGPTNIYTESARIYCESGYYNLDTETAEFNRHAQYAGDEKKATADTIRYFAGLAEVLMLGHVIVEEKDKTIAASSLRYLERSGETWIYGDPARYADSTRTITGPEIFYNEKTDQVSISGSGEIRDGSMILQSEHFVFDQATGLGRAHGHVTWVDTAQQVGIITDSLDMIQATEYILAYGSRRPIFFTLIDGDTLYIAADTLNMWSEYDTLGAGDTVKMIHAFHDVRVFKSNMQGRSDSLTFHGRDSLFTFFGAPVLWSDTTQFSADTIRMAIKEHRIKDITLERKAMIISELMGVYYDQIKGKTIIATFDSTEIREMFVTGNAESIYYTRDDQQAFIGVNKTICSKMYFTFREGQIHILKYFGENSSSMMPMGKALHNALRLEGFSWRSGERPYSVQDLLKPLEE